MEENQDPDPSSNSNGGGIAKIILITGLVLILSGAAYLALLRKDGLKLPDKIFTEYKPIPRDTFMAPLDTFANPEQGGDSLEYHSTFADTLPIPPVKNKIEDSLILPHNVKDSSGMSLFKVNTVYNKLKPDEVPDSMRIAASPVSTASEDLFEQLMLPENYSMEYKNSFDQYFRQNIVSSKSLLKLLSITGRQMLTQNNVSDSEAVLDVLSEPENVSAILIADRKGRVVYATNRKQLNVSIQQILPKIDINSTTLSWYQEKGQNITSLPLYHTFGKVGTAVLVTK